MPKIIVSPSETKILLILFSESTLQIGTPSHEKILISLPTFGIADAKSLPQLVKLPATHPH